MLFSIRKTYDRLPVPASTATTVVPPMLCSAGVMAETIVRDLAPRTAADVGCGTGTLMAALRERGVVVKGFDCSPASLRLCRNRGLNVDRFDIGHDPIPRDRFDVALSTEVAEHLPECCANRFLEVLTSLSATVVLTAATPGQDARDHVNPQPNDYWIRKMRERGYRMDQLTTWDWRLLWQKAGVHWRYHHFVMVFRRA